MNLLYRLLRWWAARKTQARFKSDVRYVEFLDMERIEESRDENQVKGTAVLKGSSVIRLAAECAEILGAFNAENYVQTTVAPPPHLLGKGPIRLTIQWAHGEAPATKAARLERELREVRQELALERAATAKAIETFAKSQAEEQ